jgi:hypothetical protein
LNAVSVYGALVPIVGAVTTVLPEVDTGLPFNVTLVVLLVDHWSRTLKPCCTLCPGKAEKDTITGVFGSVGIVAPGSVWTDVGTTEIAGAVVDGALSKGRIAPLFNTVRTWKTKKGRSAKLFVMMTSAGDLFAMYGPCGDSVFPVIVTQTS